MKNSQSTRIFSGALTLVTILLHGGGTEANAATIYKCVSGGHVTYSNIATDCSSADKTETLAPVPVEKYPLDVGIRKGQMGDAAHAYLRGMSTVIPHYDSDPRDDVYGDPIPIAVPDLYRPEYSGIGDTRDQQFRPSRLLAPHRHGTPSTSPAAGH